MGPLKDLLRRLLVREMVDVRERALAGGDVAWPCALCTFVNGPDDASCAMCANDRPARGAARRLHVAPGPLGEALVGECVMNLTTATGGGGGMEAVVESLHPHAGGLAYNGEVRFRGAAGLRYTIDPRTSIDPRATLTLYSDAARTMVVRACVRVCVCVCVCARARPCVCLRYARPHFLFARS